MSIYQFKTNIQCGGCIAAITPFLNNEPAIKEWKVDTTVPEKMLSIQSDLSTEQIITLVTKAGYKAESL